MEKEVDIFQLIDDTEKTLSDEILKFTGRIEMLEELKNYFKSKNLKVVETVSENQEN